MVKIFVGNIPSDCARKDVIEVFEKYGKVKDCDIIRNFAFVHMDDEDDAKEAIRSLNQTTFMGNEISVEQSTSRPRHTYKIYIGNLSSSADRRDLKKLFEEFGEVAECDIIKDFAFCHMTKERDAESAIKELNNTTFAGRKITVEMSRNDRDRRRDRYGGNARAYREYYERWYDYYYGRGGGMSGYNQSNYHDYYRSGGYGGRRNSYSRYRSPARRSRASRSRSRSRSDSRSRSRTRSHSPYRRHSRQDSRSRSRSRSRDRRSYSSSRSGSRN